MGMKLPPGFSLRAARVSDAALLRDVMLRCWTGTVAANSSAYRETVEDIAAQIAGGGAVLVFDGDEAVGGGRFHPVPGPAGDARPWAEIKRVGVVRELRKLGLGAPLVAALEDAARSAGAVGIQLGVREDQPKLVRFWEALGYVVASDVQLHTVNPLTPPPFTMRKWF
jgi:GNAT superfamily N-acetyltransferase